MALTNETDYLAWFDGLTSEQQCAVERAAEYFHLMLARNSGTLLTRLEQREEVAATLQRQLAAREAYIQELLLLVPAVESRER